MGCLKFLVEFGISLDELCGVLDDTTDNRPEFAGTIIRALIELRLPRQEVNPSSTKSSLVLDGIQSGESPILIGIVPVD